MDPLNFKFEHDGEYWVNFRDGSRIKVEAWQDGHGDVDIRNDDLDFLLHVTRHDGAPVNRDGIVGVTEVRSFTPSQGTITVPERDCE